MITKKQIIKKPLDILRALCDNSIMFGTDTDLRRFAGGKGQVFKKLINRIPPHEVYIETHLGGGAVMRNKRAARRNIGIEIDPQVIGLWRENNHMDIELVHGDAVQYLKGYEFSGKELVYCDPPYLRETRKGNRRVYKYEYTVDQHAELLEVIKALSCKVMISGYESELYKEQLRGWHTHTYQASCQHGVATEWIWMNYSSPLQLHDYSHLGDNSRQRERIKKKTAVWMGKLQGMPALQRQALLSAIEAVYGGGG